jgi:hypothetical protein
MSSLWFSKNRGDVRVADERSSCLSSPDPLFYSMGIYRLESFRAAVCRFHLEADWREGQLRIAKNDLIANANHWCAFPELADYRIANLNRLWPTRPNSYRFA